MIAASLMGRLGNQMFQIAATTALAKRNNDVATFPVLSRGEGTNQESQSLYTSTIFSKVVFSEDFSWLKCQYNEPYFSYCELPYRNNTLFNGYFQSEKYFIDQKETIKKLFLKDPIANNDNFVAVHVRRGDYIKLQHVHSNLAEEHNYYNLAMQEFKNKNFIFFSDDIEWCKAFFGNSHTYFEGKNEIEDFYMMTTFTNKIIANSSFSWWAAWLGESKSSKIIAPKQWFENTTSTKDLIPSRWTKI